MKTGSADIMSKKTNGQACRNWERKKGRSIKKGSEIEIQRG